MMAVMYGCRTVARSQRSVRRTQGSVSVESVILMPLFLMAVFAILQASLWVHASAVAQAAAEDGVRAGSAFDGTAESGQQMAMSILTQRAVGEQWVVSVEDDGRSLTVTVTGNATSVIPGLVVPVEESATMPWELR